MNTAQDTYNSHVFDENGLLVDGNDWCEKTANLLADQLGIGKLSIDHWKLIYALRENFERHGYSLSSFNVCGSNGKPSFWIQELFPSCSDAWRIAGLPDPGQEIRFY